MGAVQRPLIALVDQFLVSVMSMFHGKFSYVSASCAARIGIACFAFTSQDDMSILNNFDVELTRVDTC